MIETSAHLIRHVDMIRSVTEAPVALKCLTIQNCPGLIPANSPHTRALLADRERRRLIRLQPVLPYAVRGPAS